jgi:outer membrane protein assembly factor BamA
MLSRWNVGHFSKIAAGLVLTLILSDPLEASGRTARKIEWQAEGSLSVEDISSGTLLSSGTEFSDSLFRLEFARIDSICFESGYLDCEIEIDSIPGSSGDDIRITLYSGVRTKVGQINVTGQGAMGEEAILELLGVAEGSDFEPHRLEIAMRLLVRTLNEDGYPFAQAWITGVGHEPGSGRVDLSISLIEGKTAVVSDIFFEGISRTDSSIALRISRLKKDVPFDERALDRAQKYLVSSRLFEKVGKARVSGSTGNRVDLVIPVEDRKRANYFSGVFGFSRKENGDYRMNGSLKLELKNIAGTARGVGFDWLNDGLGYSRTELVLREPFLFSTPMSLDLEVRQTVNDTLYDLVSAGGYISFPIGPVWSVSGGLAGDRTTFGDGSGLEKSSRKRYRLGLTAEPGTWWRLRADLEGAMKTNDFIDGSSEDETQLIYYFESSAEAGFSGTQTFFARMAAHGIISSGDITLSEMFALGGAKTLRGYRENQFRAEKTGYINLEYRFGGESRIFLFDDVGTFFREGEGWTVKNGFGFGIRSTSKAGIVELSFGMGDQISLNETKIHISLIENF